MPLQTIFMASDPNLYRRLPFSSNSRAFMVHGSLPAIFVGFIFQKDACLGLLEIADGSQLNLNQYIVLGTELTFRTFWRPIIEVLCTFNGSNRVFS